MRKRNKVILAVVAVLVLIGLFMYLNNRQGDDGAELLARVKKGALKVVISTTGELEAKNSVEIKGPGRLRQARLWQVTIEDMVEEGTTVKKGDFVARLDPSELGDRITDRENDLEQRLSEYTQARLDTALSLREARDNLINLKFAVEEKKLVVEQSQYEPPATIRQAEMEQEKAGRTYKQALQNYSLQKEKAQAEVRRAAARLEERQLEVDFLKELAQQFEIRAPEDGMVIYRRDDRGRRMGAGATIGTWDPVVATLPDLTKMRSQTYVNEVDIRQVKPGQKVNIGLDAYPDKKLSGEVVRVANVGEQRPNSDAKVFQVDIEIFESDTTLRPAMTTSNEIIAEVHPDVLYMPLEALYSQGDSLSFVYLKKGLDIRRQQVQVGTANSNEIIVKSGLSEGDLVYLSAPDRVKDSPLVLLEGESPAADPVSIKAAP
jgi:HlyD family secretion protein